MSRSLPCQLVINTMLLALLLCSSRALAGVPKRDVCILGAGAGGMGAATFLKERHYSVVVLEKSSKLAGHCDTYTFTPQSPSTQPNWVDLGVRIFPNTTRMQEIATSPQEGLGLTYGPWSVNMETMLNRYGQGVLQTTGNFRTTENRPNYIANLGTTTPDVINVATLPPLPFDFAAFQRLVGVLASYPWLDSGEVPFPVPADLLLDFYSFLVKWDLTSLIATLIAPSFGGSMGDFTRLTTLYALRNLAPSILQLASVQNGYLFPKGGCVAVHQGMRNFIGTNNVVMNADTQWVRRRNTGSKVLLGGVRKTGSNTQTAFAYECGALIVAFPQIADNMGFLNLDNRERALFSQVERRFYFTSAILITVLNTEAAAQGFFLQNVGTSPGVVFIQWYSFGPNAPAVAYYFSDEPVDLPTATATITQQLSNLAAKGFIGAQFTVKEVYDHQFQSHPTKDALANGFFVKLKQLQGWRKTYYVGALTSYAAHHSIWEQASRLINANFPARGDDEGLDDDDDDGDDDESEDSDSSNAQSSSITTAGGSSALAVAAIVAACAVVVGVTVFGAVSMRRRRLRQAQLASMPSASVVDLEGNRLSLAEIAARSA